MKKKVFENVEIELFMFEEENIIMVSGTSSSSSGSFSASDIPVASDEEYQGPPIGQ